MSEVQELMINLDVDEFNEFYRGLNLMKDICNDADIVNGIIRQRSNDKSCMFEIDMTNLISEGNLPIIQLKQKLDLFKIFSGQEVAININDTEYRISDQYTTITFMAPNLDYIDNKYMTKEEMDEIFVLEEENLILETTITSTIADRIKTITGSFNTSTLEVVFDVETANVICSTQAADQKATVLKDIMTNRVMDEAVTNIVIIPFISDQDGSMTMKMYNIRDNVLVNKFESSIGGINYSIYTRSILSTEDD